MSDIPLAFHYARRRLAATPLVSTGAVLILSLGVGFAVVMMDLLDRVLLRQPVGVGDPERVARVYVSSSPGSYIDRTTFAVVEALETMDDDLERVAAMFPEQPSFGRGAEARRLESIACGPGYFSILRVDPHLGSLADACSRPGAAVISHAFWQQAFGGATDVVGKPLRLARDSYTIVAVTPRGFAGAGYQAVDVWLPLETRAPVAYGKNWKRDASFLQVLARLRPGVSRERANERATAAHAADRPPEWSHSQTSVVLGDVRLSRAPGLQLGTRVEVLVAGMSLVLLLITCGNVANLLLVAGLRRERELRVKTALGASRGRLMGEVLAEAGLLAAAAGVVALLAVTVGGTAIRRLILPYLASVAAPLDARVVLLTAMFCTAAAFLLGLAPAFRLTTDRMLRPGHAAAAHRSGVVDLFSGAQVALAVPVIVTATLFVVSLWNARGQDFGMQTDRVAVVTTALHETGQQSKSHELYRQMQFRLEQLPQVEAAAVVQNLPMQSATMVPVFVPGREVPAGPVMVGDDDDDPILNSVDASFFTVMRMRLTEGRLFTADDARKGTRPVAVITASLAKQFWPGEAAAGKCMYLWGRGEGEQCTEVVGVIADARLFPSIRPTRAWASAVFLPLTGGGSALLVRTKGDVGKLLESLRGEAQQTDPDLPFVEAHAFDDIFTAMLRPWRIGSVVFALLGALSIAIAAAGVMVVGAHTVARRTRELGIRSALGAQPRQLVRLVVRRNVAAVLAGAAGGLLLAWAAGGILESQVFGISAGDPWVFGAAVLGIFAVGVTAAWVPARMAARVDPVSALRSE